jgi:hypothetical protein
MRAVISLATRLLALTQSDFTAYCIVTQNHAVMGLKSVKREELP